MNKGGDERPTPAGASGFRPLWTRRSPLLYHNPQLPAGAADLPAPAVAAGGGDAGGFGCNLNRVVMILEILQ